MFVHFSQITVVNVAAVIAFVELAERFSVRFPSVALFFRESDFAIVTVLW